MQNYCCTLPPPLIPTMEHRFPPRLLLLLPTDQLPLSFWRIVNLFPHFPYYLTTDSASTNAGSSARRCHDRCTTTTATIQATSTIKRLSKFTSINTPPKSKRFIQFTLCSSQLLQFQLIFHGPLEAFGSLGAKSACILYKFTNLLDQFVEIGRTKNKVSHEEYDGNLGSALLHHCHANFSVQTHDNRSNNLIQLL